MDQYPHFGSKPSPYGTPEPPSGASAGDPPTSSASPKPSRRKWFAIGGAAAAALVIGGIVIALTPGERTLTVELGLIAVASCEEGGTGGYSDIGPGMPITVRDQDGKIIGSSSLPDTGERLDEDSRFGGCIWTTTVTVPEDAEQYAVEGGDRGAVTYSRDKLEEEDWTASLVIGG